MSKSTITPTTKQQEQNSPGNKAIILVECLDTEIGNLIDAHGEGCGCQFCHTANGLAYFLDIHSEFLEHLSETPWVPTDSYVASIQILLEQELGESCERGGPMEHFWDSYAPMPEKLKGWTGQRQDPPAAHKLVVLLEAMSQMLWQVYRECTCDDYCETCRHAWGMHFLLNGSPRTIDADVVNLGNETESLAAKVLDLM